METIFNGEFYSDDSSSMEKKLVIDGSWENAVLACSSKNDYLLGATYSCFKLWDLDSGKEILTNTAHRQRICAVAFSQDASEICTAAKDYVIVWKVLNLLRDPKCRGTIIGTILGSASCCFISQKSVLLSIDSKIYVLSKKEEQILAVLAGHELQINGLEVLKDKWLISISDDRSFKVWDLETYEMQYASTAISTSPLVSRCGLEDQDRIVIGVQGKVVVNEFDSSYTTSRCVYKFDIAQELRQFKGDLKDRSSVIEEGHPVLSICSIERIPSIDEQKNEFPMRPGGLLLVVTPKRILIIDSTTMDLIEEFSFASVMIGGEFQAEWCSFPDKPESTNKLNFVIGSQWTKETILMGLSLPDITDKPLPISVHPNQELLPSSILRSKIIPKEKQKQSEVNKKWTQRNLRQQPGTIKKGKILDDQPITFHNKVKSSGYGATPPRKMTFRPKINPSPKSTKQPISKEPISGKADRVTIIDKSYPIDTRLPSKETNRLKLSDGALNSLVFSNDGKTIACSGNNGLVFLTSGNKVSKNLSGHSKAVTQVSWSQDGEWLVSSSDDRSAIIWKNDGKIMHTVSKDTEVRSAQFYYLDKFLLLSSGRKLDMYEIILDPERSDIKTYESNSQHKLIGEFRCNDSQLITAVSAVNTFYSYTVLCGGSDYSIAILDMNQGSIVHSYEKAHVKPVHCIVQNSGSVASALPHEAYNLFLSTSMGDCVKMWDLRLKRCVQKYTAHSARAYRCKMSISPCSRYIACGSEDRTSYLYDVRTGKPLEKVGNCSDVVLDTDFNPMETGLVLCTLDGFIYDCDVE